MLLVVTRRCIFILGFLWYQLDRYVSVQTQHFAVWLSWKRFKVERGENSPRKAEAKNISLLIILEST